MSREVKTQVVWLPDGFGGGGHAEVCRATDYAALEAECERLREALEGMLEYFPEGASDGECFAVDAARAALSQQAEPASAQDERETIIVNLQRECVRLGALTNELEQRLVTHPAQTEQGVSVPRELLEDLRDCANECYNHARFRGTSGLDNYERLTEKADALLNGGEV